VVGIGNIYAAESLYQAGISPLRKANGSVVSATAYWLMPSAQRWRRQSRLVAARCATTSIAMAVPAASSFRAPSTVVRASRVRAAPGRCAPSVRRADRLSTVPIVSVEPLSMSLIEQSL
jgi:hypothetical protein